MKNVLIVILTMALSAAAFLTRPTQDDFNDFVRRSAPKDEKSKDDKAPPKRGARGARVASARDRGRDRDRDRQRDNPLAKAVFLDRVFWVEVRLDGKTLYAGCFSHWWDSSGRMVRA